MFARDFNIAGIAGGGSQSFERPAGKASLRKLAAHVDQEPLRRRSFEK